MKPTKVAMNKDGIANIDAIPAYEAGKWDKWLWFLPTHRKRVQDTEKELFQMTLAVLTLHNRLVEVVAVMNKNYKEKMAVSEEKKKDVSGYA